MNKSARDILRKRNALAFAFISVILSVSTVSAAYYFSSYQSSEKENILPSASPSATTSSTPYPTPALSVTSTASTSVSTKASFERLGGSFKATYAVLSRRLSIDGQVFKAANTETLITYSIDGSENCTLPIEMTIINPRFPWVDIGGSDVLPPLLAEDHSIAVYGKWTATVYQGSDQPFNEIELAQATLNFVVQE